MVDNTIEFGLDLDAKEFIEKGSEALEVIAKMAGQAKGLEEALKSVAVAGGLVGAALLALKATVSLVETAEQVAQVNTQFELLGQQAGIATDTLKEGLEKASGGLIDNTELLKIANKAIVEMGDSAQRLPEILELARKSAALTGQTAQEAFEGMTQALAVGNTRMLKHYGIIVDQKKAWEDYAKANNIAVGAMSQAEQRQATMNAALKQGQEALKNVDPDLAKTANTMQEISVSAHEVGEAISIAFEKIAGPAVRKFFSDLSQGAKETKNWVQATFGEGDESAEARAQLIELRVSKIKAQLEEAQKPAEGFFAKFAPMAQKSVVAKLNQELQENLTLLEEAKSKLPKKDESGGAESEGAATDRADYKKREELANKFQQDLLKLKQQFNQTEIKDAQTDEQLIQAQNNRKLLIEQEFELKKKELKANLNLTDKQREQVELQMTQLHNQQMLQLDDQFNKALLGERMSMLDNYLEHSESVAQGIERAFEVGSKKAAMQLKDFGKIGSMTFDAFASHAADMFSAFGKGSESAGDAARGAIFGFLGDMAGAMGKLELAKGLAPPPLGSPLDLIAGAALLALGGAFQALGGDSSSGSGGGGGGGSAQGGEAGPTGFGTRTDEAPSVASVSQPQKSLTLQVQGNYFDTDDTRTKLVDILRSASDVSDYRVLQIGQGS